MKLNLSKLELIFIFAETVEKARTRQTTTEIMDQLAIFNLDLRGSSKATRKVQPPQIMAMTKQNLLTVDCELPESQRPTLTTTPSQKSGRMKVKAFMREQSASKTPNK